MMQQHRARCCTHGLNNSSRRAPPLLLPPPQAAAAQGGQQLTGPPQRPPPPQQQQQQQQQEQQQQSRLQGQGLLSRPQRAPLSPHQQQQRDAAQQRVQLDDVDARMAAFDELIIEVTAPADARLAAPGTSFNNGSCGVRPVMAAAMRGLKLQRPSSVQGQAIPAIRGGHDVLLAAPAGAGSSNAALVAVLSEVLSIPRLVPGNRAWPLALLLCPTRELALQLSGQAARLVAGSQLAVKCVTGQTPIAQQVLDLRKGATDLLVATPGRLLDLLGKRAVSLGRVRFLVLEEVDDLAGPALMPLTRQLLHHPTMTSAGQQQVVALGSAALPQQQLAAAAADVLKPSAVVIRATWQPQEQQEQQQEQQQQPQRADPATALASAAAAAAAAAVPPFVAQRFLGVAPQLKPRTLLRLLASAGSGAGQALVFANSAAVADEVAGQLSAAGVEVGTLHHGRSQGQREEALQCFRFGVTQVLVVCGSVYRGLDLPDVALVINYEPPLSATEYARRAGRAGREGRPGSATTLLTTADSSAARSLAALLAAGGQGVPDWLTELAAAGGGAGGTTGASGPEAAAAAAEEGPAAGRGQQQQRQASMFTSIRSHHFGGYASTLKGGSRRGRQQQQQEQQEPPLPDTGEPGVGSAS